MTFPFTFPTEFGQQTVSPSATPFPSSAGLNFGTVGLGGPPDPRSNPFSNYGYLDARRQLLIAQANQRPLVRLWDENHNFIGQIAQEIKVEAEELYADSGTANVVIRKDNWLSNFILYDRRAEQDLHLTIDPIPTQRSWETRWGGKIINVNAKRDSGGLHTVELQGIHNREHLKHILAGANPVSPPEIQIPKMWIVPWNVRTAMVLSLFVNLARQFDPLLAIPDNIFNPTSWLGLDLSNIAPMSWPIQPQYINAYRDESRFEVFASRWTDFHSTSAPIMEDAGCIWRAYTWIYGEDTTSPHPELANLGRTMPGLLGEIAEDITQEMFLPKRTCVILACEDKSGITGPTGTFADGTINLIASTADDMLTDVIFPQYDYAGQEYTLGSAGEGPEMTVDKGTIASWFEVAPAPPWVVFRDGEYSGIVESNHSIHGATAKTVMVGGKSPGWLNDLITFGVRYGLAEISDVIEFFYPSGPVSGGEGAFQAPYTTGLDNLYNGELNDCFFAYERFSDPVRELYCGDLGFLEDFQQGTGTAWTVSGILSLRAGQWKSRAYTSFKTTVRNAAPYIYNVDFTLGDRVGFQMDNTIFVDQVAGSKFSWEYGTPVVWEFAVGTNANEIDPVSKAMRAISGIWNLFGMFAGSNDLF